MKLPKNLQQFQYFVDEKLVKVVKHEHFDLYLFSTRPGAYKHERFSEVAHMKGAVYSSRGQLVALPFRKFYNVEEIGIEDPVFDDTFTITKKLDGSLIIVFKYGGEVIVCTRGSFVSEQAIKATALLSKSIYSDIVIKNDITLLFEYTSPDNKIVVRYEYERLTLLAAFNSKTQEEINILPISAPFKSRALYNDNGTPVLITRKDFYEWKGQDIDNQEGYVIKSTKTGIRYKLKFDNYFSKHRVMSDEFTPKALLTEVLEKGSWEDSPGYSVCKEYKYIQRFRDYVDTFIEEKAIEFKKIMETLRRDNSEFILNSSVSVIVFKALQGNLNYFKTLNLCKKEILDNYPKWLK